ncbi:MAG: hypothetical protein RSB48_08820 [Akkermansia sp.]
MELTDHHDPLIPPKIPYWSWIKLLGLEAPVAAVIWALAFCAILDLNTTPFRIYQFLFVATWCITILRRLFLVIGDDPACTTQSELFFMRGNFFVFILLFAIASICGIWLILFQIGSGAISYAWIPTFFGLWYLSKLRKTKGVAPTSGRVAFAFLFGAIAFSSGVVIPSFFYSYSYSSILPFYAVQTRFLFYPPVWYLIAFVYISLMSRYFWYQEHDGGDDKNHLGLLCSLGMLLLFIICITANSWHLTVNEYWYYKTLAVGAGGLYLLNHFRGRIAYETRTSLMWLALILPALLLLLLLKSPF